MALTRSDIPALLLPGLKTEFELAYRAEEEQNVAASIATVIQTTLPAQRYAWLGTVPAMREFVDERTPSAPASYAVTIEDKVFESSIAVDRRAIEDDQLDLIRLRVRDLAHRVGQHRHQMVVETLVRGTTGLGYDGKPLIAVDHPVRGAGVSNLSAEPLSEPELALAMSAMMAVTDDHGIPLGVVPDTLLVGPANMWAAIELVESPVVVFKGTGSNPTNYKNAFQGRLKLVVSPYIRGTKAGAWFLLDTKRPVRSVILQQRSDVPVEFSALEAGSGSESAWMRDRYHYGVRARYNVGYGLWQTVFGGSL